METTTFLKTIKFEEFTKSDWECYNGAEATEDGREPLMGDIVVKCENNPNIIIDSHIMVDNNGIEIHGYSEGDLAGESYTHSFDGNFDLSHALALGLGTEITIQKLETIGFKVEHIQGENNE